MALSEESVNKFKELLKKEGKELSNEEARDSAERLVGFFNLIWDISLRDARRKRRLKKETEGFPVDGNYTCLVCGGSINESNGWYDWFGQTCLLCHKAIKEGVVPSFVCSERDSYYATWQLKDKFKIHQQAVRKQVREKRLVPRTVMNGEKVHCYIFLKKENPELIERYNPIWKSCQRNKKKVSKKWTREVKKSKTNLTLNSFK